MKKEKSTQILFLICLLSLLWTYASSQSVVRINMIFVQSKAFNTLIFMETSAPLQVRGTYYAETGPATIVIDLDKVNTDIETQIDLRNSLYVKDIKIQKTGAETARLLIQLPEKVPYRFYPSNGNTVIELNRLQKVLSGYILEPETGEKLKKMTEQEIIFQNIGISEEEDRISITTTLSDSAVYQVFAIDNPLRLVVDLFNTMYIEPTFNYPIQKFGLEKVKTGQFQIKDPYTIARMVFELSEPKFYNLRTAKNELILSFFKEVPIPVPPGSGIVKPTHPAPDSEYDRETVSSNVEVPAIQVSPEYPLPRKMTPSQEQFPEQQLWLDTIASDKTSSPGEIISLEFEDADSRDVILNYAETKKLRRIGRYPLVRFESEAPTAELVKIYFDRYARDIKFGFELTGYGDLYRPFVEQIKTASFKEKQLRTGDKLLWMLFRSGGKVKVVENLEWAGRDPLPVFSFTVKKDYNHYEFIIPRACGNLALMKVEEVIPDAICDITVDPSMANINDPITVDMSGSQHAKSMEVKVFDSEGKNIATHTLSPDSPKWQIEFDKPGEYFFKSRAFNIKDKPSENPCEAKTYINIPPVCELWTTCLPCIDYVGKLIVFNVSGSTHPDGEIVKANFEITDESGDVVDTFEDSEKPFVWEKIFEKPGLYIITAFVTDDFGAESEPSRVVEEVIQRRMFLLADSNLLYDRSSNAPFVALRIGVLYKIIPDTLDFFISGGGAGSLNVEPWEYFFMANMILNVHAGPVFFGAGAGISTRVEEPGRTDTELIANVGFDVFNYYKSVGSIFLEARGPAVRARSFSDHYKLMLGFRLIF
ncbi:MAG: AMIN domain-containing protein [Candidatus Aminicenantes bacterium]|nr:MAG: AMIN domain-containing protein [Candidatus Aminicenantes bacterium]